MPSSSNLAPDVESALEWLKRYVEADPRELQGRFHLQTISSALRGAAAATREPSDEELVEWGRQQPSRLPPWGVGTTKADYLRAVRAVLTRLRGVAVVEPPAGSPAADPEGS